MLSIEQELNIIMISQRTREQPEFSPAYSNYANFPKFLKELPATWLSMLLCVSYFREEEFKKLLLCLTVVNQVIVYSITEM